MVTVGMNYVVLPGKRDLFEEKFADVLTALEDAEGHEKSVLWRDVANDYSYLITSDWNDEDAFKAFITSEAFRSVTNWGKDEILAGRPQHKLYRH